MLHGFMYFRGWWQMLISGCCWWVKPDPGKASQETSSLMIGCLSQKRALHQWPESVNHTLDLFITGAWQWSILQTSDSPLTLTLIQTRSWRRSWIMFSRSSCHPALSVFKHFHWAGEGVHQLVWAEVWSRSSQIYSSALHSRRSETHEITRRDDQGKSSVICFYWAMWSEISWV